jgi:hypothetical protein
MTFSRRQFLESAVAVAAASLLARRAGAEDHAAPMLETRRPLLNNRYFTLNSVIRVNQIESTRSNGIGSDEASLHTPEAVQQFRDAFEKGWPGGRMAWAFSWQALQDPRDNYKAIREKIAGYHATFGDEITFIPGGYFANMYNTREQVNADLHEALQRVSEMVGGGYRPKSIVAGFLAADNLRYLAEHENIHVCQGTIWSQYAVDNGDGEGSISYPYYPSREHFCKPAQGREDFIDCVNLDGWTCDFIAARRAGSTKSYNSRMGVGPIETFLNLGPDLGMNEIMATSSAHFGAGFDLNRFAWLTTCWELSLLNYKGAGYREMQLECLTKWLSEIRRLWPESECLTQGEFGTLWRHHYKDNSNVDYRFVQRGSGIFGSDEELEIRWFMNKEFRLALLHNWKTKSPELAIDFTRYDLPAKEPKALGRNWSLINRLNQKGLRPEDRPVPLKEFAADERALIGKHYPELLS